MTLIRPTPREAATRRVALRTEEDTEWMPPPLARGAFGRQRYPVVILRDRAS
jgi:hypothetical protein